ncbi:hypothetical protein ACFY7Y_00755 [Streptomyces virginiae]|uniref:hypothetical protein n=1 Tax=Streptomyces virginiae TaxID=1961 RepID=UPI0036BCFFAA
MGRLTATWLQERKNTPEPTRVERLRSQGLDMARVWAQTRGTAEPIRTDLLAEVESSARHAHREVKL